MIISLIVFIGSGLFLTTIWYSKRSELNGGRALIHIGSDDRDIKLRSLHNRGRAYIESVDSVYLKNKLHDIAEKSEHFGLKLAEYVVKRFSKIRDAVSGKDIPKNRGLVSFFMGYVDSHSAASQGSRETTKKTLK